MDLVRRRFRDEYVFTKVNIHQATIDMEHEWKIVLKKDQFKEDINKLLSNFCLELIHTCKNK